MRRFFYLLLPCFLLVDCIAQSQGLSKREFIQLSSDAHRHYTELNFHEALPLYLKLDSISPNTPKYMFPTGVCYLYVNNITKALPYLEACKHKEEINTASLDYYLGKAYHLNGNFVKAILAYSEYKSFFSHKKSKLHKNLFADIDQEIEYCKNGIDLHTRPVKVTIVNLGPGINSEYPEYGPVISGDEREIIITSSRPDTKGGKRDYSTDGHYFEDLYISTSDGKQWAPLTRMSDSVNTEDHDASVALSADGKKLILYRYTDDMLQIGGSGDLYISTNSNFKWGEAEKLTFSDGKSWESSATISNDGKTIIFSSNRDKGQGGTDLYSVIQNAEGVWSIPVSLGTTINTARDEDSPFLMPDGKTLYFSSKGHNSMGGYDVFVSHLSSETLTWSKPENIGYPLNTPHDDLHFSWSSDGKKMYFASIRPEGYGDRDIYYAELHVEEKDSILIRTLITATVKDSSSQSTLDATIKVYELDSTGATTSNIKQYNVTAVETSSKIELVKGKAYLLVVEAKGYKTYSEKVDLTLQEIPNVEKSFSVSKEE